MRRCDCYWNYALPLIAGMMLLLLTPGCSKSSSESPASATATAVTNTFENANPATRDLARSGAAALSENDLPGALDRFQSLTERQDLTDEQRRAASQAFGNTLKQINEAARKGDARAQEALKNYMLTK